LSSPCLFYFWQRSSVFAFTPKAAALSGKESTLWGLAGVHPLTTSNPHTNFTFCKTLHPSPPQKSSGQPVHPTSKPIKLILHRPVNLPPVHFLSFHLDFHPSLRLALPSGCLVTNPPLAMIVSLFSTFDPLQGVRVLSWGSCLAPLPFFPAIPGLVSSLPTTLFHQATIPLKQELDTLRPPFGASQLLPLVCFTLLLSFNVFGLVPFSFTPSAHLSFTFRFALPL
jgi:hypothetical protein